MKLNRGIIIILLVLGTMLTAFVAGTIGSKLQPLALGEMTIQSQGIEKAR